jgi:hypothetical protein
MIVCVCVCFVPFSMASFLFLYFRRSEKGRDREGKGDGHPSGETQGKKGTKKAHASRHGNIRKGPLYV